MAKQHLYRIGYYSYEDSGEVVLIHDRKISKEEFQNMFVEATLEILINRRAKIRWLDTPEGGYHDHEKKEFTEGTYRRYDGKEYDTMEEYLEERGYKYWTHFSDIYREVVFIMVELYGFAVAEYEQDESVNGWGGICDPDRHFGEDEELLDRIMNEFNKRMKK